MIAVRKANKRDLEELVRMCLQWPGAPANQDPELLRVLFAQTLSDDDSTVYLAFENEATLGFAHITFQARPVRLGWRATIEELHAKSGFESKIETFLLHAIVAECRERGDVIALYLLTQPDLEPRQYEFYTTLGFRERGREVLIWNQSLV